MKDDKSKNENVIEGIFSASADEFAGAVGEVVDEGAGVEEEGGAGVAGGEEEGGAGGEEEGGAGVEEAITGEAGDVIFEADAAWFTNPAPENEDEQIKQKDDAKMARLRGDRRILILEARSHLKAPGAITLFDGTSKSQTHKYKGFCIFNENTQLRKTGVLTVKLKLRSSQIDPGALSRYLTTYANYKGTGAEAVDQIAHDLFILLRPRSVAVSLAITEIDSDVTYNGGYDWE